MRPDDGAEHAGLAHGGDKGLVAAALVVVDVLADDPPLVEAEDRLAVDLVGVREAVEDEPATASAPAGTARAMGLLTGG